MAWNLSARIYKKLLTVIVSGKENWESGLGERLFFLQIHFCSVYMFY